MQNPWTFTLKFTSNSSCLLRWSHLWKSLNRTSAYHWYIPMTPYFCKVTFIQYCPSLLFPIFQTIPFPKPILCLLSKNLHSVVQFSTTSTCYSVHNWVLHKLSKVLKDPFSNRLLHPWHVSTWRSSLCVPCVSFSVNEVKIFSIHAPAGAKYVNDPSNASYSSAFPPLDLTSRAHLEHAFQFQF